MLSKYFFIGLGGAIGAIVRVGLSQLFPPLLLGVPCPILFVNILGCLMMGLLTESLALYWTISNEMQYFLSPGFLGGFTTFSTFALEFGLLYEKNHYMTATLYAMLSVGLSIGAFFLGIKIIRLL